MMKKIFALILLVSMLLGLCACGQRYPTNNGNSDRQPESVNYNNATNSIMPFWVTNDALYYSHAPMYFMNYYVADENGTKKIKSD